MKYKEEYKQYLIIKLEMLKIKMKVNSQWEWQSSPPDTVLVSILSTVLETFEEDSKDPLELYGTLKDVYTDLNVSLVKHGEKPVMTYEEFVTMSRDKELKKLGI